MWLWVCQSAHVGAQCTIECVVLTHYVQHFLVSSPTFFLYLSLLLCRTVGRGSCSYLSCYRFTHHSCAVCIAMSRQRVEMYTCVLACLGVGETHGPFICCSYRFLTLCDLHLVCVKKKYTEKEQHNCLKNCHKLRSIVILNCSRTSWIKWIVKVLCHFREVQYFVKASSTKLFVETKKPVERGL